MFIASINLLAVGTSAIVSTALGFLWFMVVFREPYLQGLGKTAEALAKGPSTLVAATMQLIGSLVMAYVLALLMERSSAQTVSGGLWWGLLAWLGFVAAVIGPLYAFQAFSLTFFLISAGYPLVTLLVTGAILGGWR